MSSKNPLLFLVGPTATGKSNLALEIARETNACIVNCDSQQVYVGVDIGSAKPPQCVRSEVPHELFDLVGAGEEFTAGEFRRRALDLIKSKKSQQNLIFVGGSGFYLRALEHGMYEVPEVPESIKVELQRELALNGCKHLWAELELRDPDYAQELSPNDQYRIVRALGVLRAGDQTMTDIKRRFAQGDQKLEWPVVKVGLFADRQWLRQQVKNRTESMLEQGFVQEVQGLMDRGLKNWSPLRSVGYKEVVSYIEGELLQEQLVEEITKSTMRLAKRQMTWFRKDSSIHWFESPHQLDEARQFCLASLQSQNTVKDKS